MRLSFSLIGAICVLHLLTACGTPASSAVGTSPAPSVAPITIPPSPAPTTIAAATPALTATRIAVSFKSDVQPILTKYCVKCHSDQSILGKPPNNFRVTTYADLMKGGEYGIDVIPFKPDDSRLIFFIIGKRMPGDGTSVDPQDLETLIKWVAAGAQNN